MTPPPTMTTRAWVGKRSDMGDSFSGLANVSLDRLSNTNVPSSIMNNTNVSSSVLEPLSDALGRR
jgi:hypothetical protein